MARKVILLDTSILIDYFRKSDKSKSKWVSLFSEGYDFAISAITYYEIYSGAKEVQLKFWNEILKRIDILPFDENAAKASIEINTELRKKSKQIDIADLFIAATAVSNELSLATLNVRHFERVGALKIIT